jgi:hypothetical protein
MNWFDKYFEAFRAFPFLAEPSNDLVVEDENGTMYKIDEPESVTLDRIQRSIEVGRNLFFEELKPFDQYPQETTQY